MQHEAFGHAESPNTAVCEVHGCMDPSPPALTPLQPAAHHPSLPDLPARPRSRRPPTTSPGCTCTWTKKPVPLNPDVQFLLGWVRGSGSDYARTGAGPRVAGVRARALCVRDGFVAGCACRG